MRRRRRLAAAIAAGLALAGLGGWGVAQQHGGAARAADADETPGPPQPAATLADGRVVTLSPAARRRAGIATLSLTNTRHRELLAAFGSVRDPQPLTELAGRAARAEADLAAAAAKLDASRTARDRARRLFKDRQNISAAQLEAAEATYRVDAAAAAAARSRQHLLALTAQQDWGPVLGPAIGADAPLFEDIVTRRVVLVQVTLQPHEHATLPPAAAFVRRGDGASLPLHFVSAAPRTDPTVQGLSLLFTAAADSGLVPGMRVAAFVVRHATIEGVVVPQSAVIWEHGRAWAYFRTGPGTFARRPIATDRPARAGGYIVPGIANHAAVVVAGAQLLLSQEFRAQTSAGGVGDTD